MLQTTSESARKMDWILFLGLAALTLLGFVAIYSLSLSREPDTLWTLKKQAIAAAAGLAGAYLLVRLHYKSLHNFAPHVYVLSLLLLVAVAIFGESVRGTRGWFNLGPVNFQPVEVAKLGVIIALARFFSAQPRHALGLKELAWSGVIVGIPAALVMLQPDFGSAMLLVGTWGIMALLTGIRRSVLWTGIVSVVVAIVAGWFFLAPFQKDRILTFLDPARDPLGRGYNVIQARIAIGSGGVWGRGIGFGSQSQLRFVPEAQTDFIVSVIGEELGLIGMLLLLGIFCLVLVRSVQAAALAEDDFGALLCLGIVALFGLQSVVNIGMNVGVLPVTGITLPFVSYGASSMIATWLAGGILLSVTTGRITRENVHYE